MDGGGDKGKWKSDVWRALILRVGFISDFVHVSIDDKQILEAK
jgi:hypothetical protein